MSFLLLKIEYMFSQYAGGRGGGGLVVGKKKKRKGREMGTGLPHSMLQSDWPG